MACPWASLLSSMAPLLPSLPGPSLLGPLQPSPTLANSRL